MISKRLLFLWSFFRISSCACLMLTLTGCADLPVLVRSDPINIDGTEFFLFRFEKPDRTLLFAKSEVTCGEFCEFLNGIAYQQEPLSVRHFQPQFRPSAGNDTKKSVYFVEHADSNIIRKEGCFIPRGEASTPINCATFFGAQAYCEWLGERLGKTVALPSAKLWLACAKVARLKKLPIEGCPGGVWEWCSDVLYPDDPSMPPKAVVRGGEYFSRRRARITDKAYSLLFSGGEGEQAQGFRIIVYDKLERSPSGSPGSTENNN